jgi:hypothetical protein
LREWIGEVMGDPISCPSDDGEQLTSTGLVYPRSDSSGVTFTTNVYATQAHWTVSGTQLLYWEGQSVDPPADALPVGSCKAVLAAYSPGFVWGGQVSPLGRFNGSAVAACLGTESFAGGNGIWCLLADDRPAPIDGADPCTAFRSLVREDDGTLLGIAHESAALDVVRRLRWNAGGFAVVDEFESCASSPPVRVPPALRDDFAGLAAFCHYMD